MGNAIMNAEDLKTIVDSIKVLRAKVERLSKRESGDVDVNLIMAELLKKIYRSEFRLEAGELFYGGVSLGSIKGEAGKDGRDGVDGADGKDGIDGKDGTDGKDGKNGRDGRDGVDGKDGRDGLDGREVVLEIIDDAVFYGYAGGEFIKLIELDKLKGKDGRAGGRGYTPQRGVDYWTDEDRAEMFGDIEQNGFVRDENYVHTDNNFADELKAKVTSLDSVVYEVQAAPFETVSCTQEIVAGDLKPWYEDFYYIHSKEDEICGFSICSERNGEQFSKKMFCSNADFAKLSVGMAVDFIEPEIVEEYASEKDFPARGKEGVFYRALDTDGYYTWFDEAYHRNTLYKFKMRPHEVNAPMLTVPEHMRGKNLSVDYDVSVSTLGVSNLLYAVVRPYNTVYYKTACTYHTYYGINGFIFDNLAVEQNKYLRESGNITLIKNDKDMICALNRRCVLSSAIAFGTGSYMVGPNDSKYAAAAPTFGIMVPRDFDYSHDFSADVTGVAIYPRGDGSFKVANGSRYVIRSLS